MDNAEGPEDRPAPPDDAPRDWLGPRDELVRLGPVGDRAHPRDGAPRHVDPGARPAPPAGAQAFWSPEAAALHLPGEGFAPAVSGRRLSWVAAAASVTVAFALGTGIVGGTAPPARMAATPTAQPPLTAAPAQSAAPHGSPVESASRVRGRSLRLSGARRARTRSARSRPRRSSLLRSRPTRSRPGHRRPTATRAPVLAAGPPVPLRTSAPPSAAGGAGEATLPATREAARGCFPGDPGC